MSKDKHFVPTAKVADSEVVASQLMNRVEQGRAKIPVWPEAAEEALKLSKNPMVDLREIARVIASDTGLYAEILAVVNSPFYSRGARITDLGVALVRLGLETTRTILMQSIVMSSIFKSKKFSNEIKGLLYHALHHAYLARELAPMLGLGRDTLFTFGLLHDIGVVIAYKLMEDLRYPISGDDARKAALANHAAIGATVLAQNNVPEEVTEPILHHGDSQPEGEHAPFVEALWVLSGVLYSYPEYPVDLRSWFEDPVRDAAFMNTRLAPGDMKRIYEEVVPRVLDGVNTLVAMSARR